MESTGEGQWSWWQEQQVSRTQPVPLTDDAYLTGPDATSVDSAESGDSPTPPRPSKDPVRAGLIGLVGVLTVTLGVVSFLRFRPDNSADAAAAVTTSAPDGQVSVVASATSAPPSIVTTTLPTTTAAPSSTTVPSSSTTAPSTTASPRAGDGPSAPLDVEVVSTSSSGAEIRWRSDDCVGSIYQVGEFDQGGGGFPDVNRCWFNHVIIAGDPAFSPPLNPDTDYVVRIQAVDKDGNVSEPVEVSFRTAS